MLIGFYKFPAHVPAEGTTNGSPHIFNRKEIGINRYMAASVSVVKAFNRLVERRLAKRKYNHGIILTEAGAKVGEASK